MDAFALACFPYLCLKFCDGGKHREEHAPFRCCGINRLFQDAQAYAFGSQRMGDVVQVACGPRQPIEASYNKRVPLANAARQ